MDTRFLEQETLAIEGKRKSLLWRGDTRFWERGHSLFGEGTLAFAREEIFAFREAINFQSLDD